MGVHPAAKFNAIYPELSKSLGVPLYPFFLDGVAGDAKLNQADGFDCQGCAWPDPAPGHRHTAEFCENGAKAVAEEATVKRAGPDLFARYTVEQLASRSDYWIGKRGRLTEPLEHIDSNTLHRVAD